MVPQIDQHENNAALNPQADQIDPVLAFDRVLGSFQFTNGRIPNRMISHRSGFLVIVKNMTDEPGRAQADSDQEKKPQPADPALFGI